MSNVEFIKFPEVLVKLGISRSQYFLHRDSLPKPFKLIPGGRSQRWVKSEIDEYINARLTNRQMEMGL